MSLKKIRKYLSLLFTVLIMLTIVPVMQVKAADSYTQVSNYTELMSALKSNVEVIELTDDIQLLPQEKTNTDGSITYLPITINRSVTITSASGKKFKLYSPKINSMRHFIVQGTSAKPIQVNFVNVIFSGLDENDDSNESGGVYVRFAEVTMDKVEMSNIYAGELSGTYGASSAIYVYGSVVTQAKPNKVILKDSLIMDNVNEAGTASKLSGRGTVHVQYRSEIEIYNTTFRNNTVNSQGGALYLTGSSFIIEDSYFEENYATSQGGAIFMMPSKNGDSSTMVVKNTVFENNSSASGGAIQLYGFENLATPLTSNVEIYSTKFINNVATGRVDGEKVIGQGGAISITHGYDVTFNLHIEMSEFIGNQAPRGGAIGLIDQYSNINGTVNFTILDTLFEDNQAVIDAEDAVSLMDGGAIHLGSETGNIQMTIQGNTLFKNNHALDGNGGAIFTYDYTWVKILEDVVFQDNVAKEHYFLEDSNIIAVHQQQVLSDQYTAPFNYAYNNADVNYQDGAKALVYRVYFMDKEANTPLLEIKVMIGAEGEIIYADDFYQAILDYIYLENSDFLILTANSENEIYLYYEKVEDQKDIQVTYEVKYLEKGSNKSLKPKLSFTTSINTLVKEDMHIETIEGYKFIESDGSMMLENENGSYVFHYYYEAISTDSGKEPEQNKPIDKLPQVKPSEPVKPTEPEKPIDTSRPLDSNNNQKPLLPNTGIGSFTLLAGGCAVALGILILVLVKAKKHLFSRS